MSIVIHLIKPERAVADKEKARVAKRHTGFLLDSKWWAHQDSNLGPSGYEPDVLYQQTAQNRHVTGSPFRWWQFWWQLSD